MGWKMSGGIEREREIRMNFKFSFLFFSFRDTIQVKGKGKMRTYYVKLSDEMYLVEEEWTKEIILS